MLQVKHNKLSFFVKEAFAHTVSLWRGIEWDGRSAVYSRPYESTLVFLYSKHLYCYQSTVHPSTLYICTLVQVNVAPSSFILETSLLTVNPIVYIASHQNINLTLSWLLNKHKWLHSVKDERVLSISWGRRDQAIVSGKSICCNGPTWVLSERYSHKKLQKKRKS